MPQEVAPDRCDPVGSGDFAAGQQQFPPNNTSSFAAQVVGAAPNDTEIYVATTRPWCAFSPTCGGMGSIVDLLAFHPDAPGRWALRTGLAIALGVVELQHCRPALVLVHRDVLGWLHSECRDLVLLTSDQHEARRILLQIDTLEAEDQRHANHLNSLLTLPRSGPATRVILPPRRAAA
jgi:hypothetical protein